MFVCVLFRCLECWYKFSPAGAVHAARWVRSSSGTGRCFRRHTHMHTNLSVIVSLSPLATPFITVLAFGVRTTWDTKKVPFLLQVTSSCVSVGYVTHMQRQSASLFTVTHCSTLNFFFCKTFYLQYFTLKWNEWIQMQSIHQLCVLKGYNSSSFFIFVI